MRKRLVELIRLEVIEIMGCSEHQQKVEETFKEQTVVFGIFNFCKNVNDLLSGKTKHIAPNCNFVEQMAFDFKLKNKDIGKYGTL